MNILLKPHIQSIKNKFLLKKSGGQEYVLLSFFILVASLIWYSTKKLLIELEVISDLAYLSPARPIGLVLLLLTFMLFLSNLVFSIGSLYKGADLDIVNSSPLGLTKFFTGKFVYIFFQSSWMPLTFILPFLWAHGVHYNADFTYYFWSFALTLVYFLLPTCIAIIISILGALVFPLTKTREALFICACLFIFFLFRLIKLASETGKNITQAEEVLRIVDIITLPNLTWLPINWLAEALNELLNKEILSFGTYSLALLFLALTLISFTYFCLNLMYRFAYNRILSSKAKTRILNLNFLGFGKFFDSTTQALVEKELRAFVRDMGQIIQLILLTTICMIYLFHLRVFAVIDSIPIGKRENWNLFLLIANSTMGAFLCTAICTRLVFPSISYEGRAFWLLASSPLKLSNLLTIKAKIWFLPVALIGTIFMTVGAYNLSATTPVILLHLIGALLISFGLVNLAIGMGAIFARFDWEYSQQLVASFGSFIFMVFALTLIFVSVICCFIPILVLPKLVNFYPPSVLCNIIGGVIGIILVFVLNFFVSKFAIKTGAKSLDRKLN